MKIVRYIDSAGHTGQGWLDESGGVRVLKGSFGSFVKSEQVVTGAKLLAPVEPRVIYAIGLNYKAHAAETGAQTPKYPMVFMKAVSALQHPEQPIVLPRQLASDQVDYEAELAIVIGRDAKNVSAENALDYVLGFTCANDVSARDWQAVQRGGGQFCRAKTFDTFCPLGPTLVTPDEIGNADALRIATRVNGETLQDSTTADMIFSIGELIAFLSGSTTLLANTVILTGTPEGVGVARQPQRFLQAGDVVEIEIENIGILRNPVVEETASI